MERILDLLLSRPTEVAPIPDLDDWWSRHRAAATDFDVPQVARHSDWPEVARERLAARIAAARGLAIADPTSAGVHVGLGGLIAETARRLEVAWASLGG